MKTSAASTLETLLATESPADLGPGPRAGVQDEASIRKALGAVPEGRDREALLALILLWHDHHEAAHAIAQAIESPDGSYVHAILHRREPDYGNAKYWFRKVGSHPAYQNLASEVSAFLAGKGAAADDLGRKLMPGGRWDAFAFVDVCEAARNEAARGNARNGEWLRQIQRLEIKTLAEYLSGSQPTAG
jgi:hypothetical protein